MAPGMSQRHGRDGHRWDPRSELTPNPVTHLSPPGQGVIEGAVGTRRGNVTYLKVLEVTGIWSGVGIRSAEAVRGVPRPTGEERGAAPACPGPVLSRTGAREPLAHPTAV